MGKILDKKAGATTKHEIRATVVLGANGRIVIPADVREALGLTEGARLTLRAGPDGIVIRSAAMALRALSARVAPTGRAGRSRVDQFIAGKRAEAARE